LAILKHVSFLQGGDGGRTHRRGRGAARRGGWLVGLALAGLLLFVAPASATFHLMKVREVYPGGTAGYVELQLLAVGEYQVGGHHLVTYNADGTVANDFILPSNVSPASRNNATVLITGPDYATAFPSGPSTNESDPNLNLSASGGAVCWVEGEPPDCVAWGNFTGPLPAHTPSLLVGSPASPAGVTAGKALHRTIAPGCATILEAGDDSDVSATDFSEQTPNPRNNASPVTETDCEVPEAQIESKPSNPTKSTSAEFTFSSSPSGSAFECKLDTGAYEECLNEDEDPFVYPGPLADGSHTFQVRAVNSQGAGDPALYIWIVDTQAPTATIKSGPANPSTGASAVFTYESSQLGSSFECSLASQGQADGFASCPSTGTTYTSLADGSYTFKVRATDKAGNQGSATAYGWQVNNSLVVVPPPLPLPPPLASIPPPVTIPRPPAALRCKKSFVKKKVKGKTHCVKKKKKKKRKRKH
jgi:hypothetical protein